MSTSVYQQTKACGVLLLMLFSSISASAQSYMLYSIIGNYLAEIDPATGAATEIAPLNPTFTYINGLTYEPNLDLLLTVVDWRFNPRLASIDRCTGEITIIGFIDGQSPFLDIQLLEGMAYNPDDGLLYASGYETAPPVNPFSRRLMTVDPLTGNASIVATISGTCNNEADALAFTPGAYYSLDGCPNPIRLYSIDLATGNSTYIGANTATASRLAAHPATGELYSVSPGNRTLYTISTTNGEASLIGEIHSSADFDGGLVHSIAFAPDEDGATHCLDNCLMASYPFNGNAIDETGNGYDGSVNGASLVADRYGNPNSAFSFDGINDYISLPPDDFLLNEYTYSAWVKLASIPSNRDYYCFMQIGDTGGKDQVLTIANDPGHLNIGPSGGSWDINGTPHSLSTGSLPNAQEWLHVAFTRSNDEASLYVNGIEVDHLSISGQDAGYGNNPLATIGSRRAFNQFFHGFIDDVKIFSCVLSNSEISDLYNCTVTCYFDGDSDGFGDSNSPQEFCEACGEGYVPENTDNCPTTPNPTQSDLDLDGLGDACDPGTSIYVVVDNLNEYIGALSLISGIEKALITRLQHIATKFCTGSNPNVVITQLNRIIDYLQYHSGGQIPEADAEYLIAQLQALIDAIRAGTVKCSPERAPVPSSGISAQAANAESPTFRLYPNPTTGVLTLQLPDYLEQEVAITIHDAFGRRVYAQMEGTLEVPSISLNLAEQALPNGVYFLAVMAKGERQVKQVVLAR